MGRAWGEDSHTAGHVRGRRATAARAARGPRTQDGNFGKQSVGCIRGLQI